MAPRERPSAPLPVTAKLSGSSHPGTHANRGPGELRAAKSEAPLSSPHPHIPCASLPVTPPETSSEEAAGCRMPPLPAPPPTPHMTERLRAPGTICIPLCRPSLDMLSPRLHTDALRACLASPHRAPAGGGPHHAQKPHPSHGAHTGSPTPVSLLHAPFCCLVLPQQTSMPSQSGLCKHSPPLFLPNLLQVLEAQEPMLLAKHTPAPSPEPCSSFHSSMHFLGDLHSDLCSPPLQLRDT